MKYRVCILSLLVCVALQPLNVFAKSNSPLPFPQHLVPLEGDKYPKYLSNGDMPEPLEDNVSIEDKTLASEDEIVVGELSAEEIKGRDAEAEPYKFQKMNFDVYAGGIHAVKAKMVIDYRDDPRYSMVFVAETRGLLGSLAPWMGSFKSNGWGLDNGSLAPDMHESVARWREEKEVKTYNYTKDGGFQNMVTLYKHKKPKTYVPPDELTNNTTDALTATLLVMEHVARGGECTGSSEVFDGKRRFELIFRHTRFVMIEESRYNAYSGLAAECTVEVKPIAGAWHKKPRGWLSIQEQGRDRGMMPTVWFAQITRNAVSVPVRVRVKTAYGTLFMHMTRYESGNTILLSEK